MKNFKFNRTPIDIGAKKNKFKWLLLSFILSIASINTALGGGALQKDACIYFDNSVSNWNYTYVYFNVNDQFCWAMMKIDHTKLYLYNRTDETWNDYPFIRIFTDNDSWPNGEEVKGWDNMSTWASDYTNTYNNYTFTAYKLYYVKPDATHYGSLSVGHIGDDYNALNKTMTIKAKVSTDGESSYNIANTPGALTVSSYSFSNYYTCETATSGNVSAGSASNTLTVGYRAELSLAAASVTGYTFKGWYAGDDKISSTSSTTDYPNTATTYYAYYKANRCTVVFNKNASDATGTMSNQIYTYNIEQSLRTNVFTRSNYVFLGWATSQENANAGIVAYNDGASLKNLSTTDGATLNLYAVWVDQFGLYGTGDIFAVSWDTWIGFPNSATNMYGKSITLTKGNTYVFKVVDRSGSTTWWGNNSGSGNLSIDRSKSGSSQQLYSGTTESDNITITPDVTGDYTFSFNSSSHALTITYPTSYTITFGIGALNGSTSAITVTASPSFSSGDYVLRSTAVTFNKGTTKDGYKFIGWYSNNDGTGTCHSSTDGNWTSDANTRSGDITVYACYQYKEYSITYLDKDGSEYSGNNIGALPLTHTYNTATELVNGTKTGYTFIGWYANSDCTGDPITSLGATAYIDDITLYAKWTEDTHEVTLANDGHGVVKIGGTTVTSVSGIGITTASSEITAVPNTGYRFVNWTGHIGSGVTIASGSTTSATITINATADSKTITANFTAETYSVTLNTNDGTINADNVTSYTYGIGATLPTNVTKSGYDFGGWFDNEGLTGSAVTTISTSDTGNKTYWAKWTEHTYTDGVLNKTTGSTAGAYSVTFHDNKIVVNTEPGKDGYHVDGYYLGYDEVKGDYSNRIADQNGSLYTVDVTGYVESQTWIYAGIPTLYTKWEENTYSIKLMRNDGTEDYTTSTVTMGKNNYTPAISVPTRTGYDFAGYYTDASEGTQVIDGEGHKIGATYFDNDANWIYPDDATFYAHWDEVTLTFVGTTDANWHTASNWDPACVPTSGHDVTINAETTISGSAVAKSVSIGDGGKVTIEPTGVLEVAGTITNDNPNKLDVQSRGALIFNSTGTTYATVHMSTADVTGNKFQFITLPVYGVAVKDKFAGEGIYTFAWKYGEGWERRGYYDDLRAFEAILLKGKSSMSFSGSLIPTTDLYYTLSYDASKVSGDVYMYGNSWTAPIRRSDIECSGVVSVNILSGSTNGWEGVVAGDVIPAMQAYAVVVGSSGGSVDIDYDKAVRGAKTSPNAPLRSPKRVESSVLDYLSIYVATNDMQTRIRLLENEQFTDGMDEGYEALYMEGQGYAGELYAQAEKRMNVLATPDLEGTVLGFVPGETTNYTISFKGDGKGYYLNDMLTQQSTLIAEGNTFTFNPDVATNATRFVISRTPMIGNTATGVDQVNEGTHARKQLIDGVLYIIRDGKIYEATGMLVK